MEDLTFSRGIERLEAAFRNGQESSGATLKLYWEYLQDMSDEEFNKKVNEIILHDNYFPSIARLKDEPPERIRERKVIT